MANSTALAQAFAHKPALLHFECEAHGLAGAMTLFAVCLHVCDIGDRAVISQKAMLSASGVFFIQKQ